MVFDKVPVGEPKKRLNSGVNEMRRASVEPLADFRKRARKSD